MSLTQPLNAAHGGCARHDHSQRIPVVGWELGAVHVCRQQDVGPGVQRHVQRDGRTEVHARRVYVRPCELCQWCIYTTTRFSG